MKKTKYEIFHNIDDEKTTYLNDDAGLIEFAREIAKENGDNNEFSFKTSVDATRYINEYCPNLTLKGEDKREYMCTNCGGGFKRVEMSIAGEDHNEDENENDFCLDCCPL